MTILFLAFLLWQYLFDIPEIVNPLTHKNIIFFLLRSIFCWYKHWSCFQRLLSPTSHSRHEGVDPLYRTAPEFGEQFNATVNAPLIFTHSTVNPALLFLRQLLYPESVGLCAKSATFRSQFFGTFLFLLYFNFLSFGAFQPDNYSNPACWTWDDNNQISVTFAKYHPL